MNFYALFAVKISKIFQLAVCRKTQYISLHNRQKILDCEENNVIEVLSLEYLPTSND